MGYYTGNDWETQGGGSQTSVYETFPWYGTHNVYQRIKTTISRKAGVSLATAESCTSENNMNTRQLWGRFADGSTFYHWSVNCEGDRTNYAYEQIGGSNLYGLTKTREDITAWLV